MKMKEQEKKDLNQEEMSQVSGGTFTPNHFSGSMYEKAGIQVIDHFIDKDEFLWHGTDVGYATANSIVRFYKKYGREPVSLSEVDRFVQTPGSCCNRG